MDDIERAKSALFHLDAGCPRDEWLRAGMGAKAAGLSFDDFNKWSASGGNYAGENGCRNVWKSFSASGPVTANSLYAMAFAQGWQDPAKSRAKAIQMDNASRACAVPARPVQVMPQRLEKFECASAARVWDLCEPATPAHEYIVKKGGTTVGVRCYPHEAPPLTIRGQNVAGYLVVPCRDLNGTLQTLQFVPGAGKKLNLAGASFKSGCFVVGDIASAGLIVIVEGIGQAWAVAKATGAAAVVCFGAGRMSTVAHALRNKYSSSRLLVFPDRAKESQAETIALAINGEWCELPQDKPSNYDANDYMQEHGAEALAKLLNQVKAVPMRFKLWSGADLSNAPPMRWMVRGVLPLEGLAALYGPSGSGKSFLALDIAAAIAGGAATWFGRRTKQAPVTYCALEGEAGIGKRVKAWSLHHNQPVPNSLRFIAQPFDLLHSRDVEELAKAVHARGSASGLLIIDTLNRAVPGADENSSVDMGNIIAAAKRLQVLIGGLVLLVHHTGKDATKGLRGHSSLYAALDGAIEVSRCDKRRVWSVAKSKDDEDGKASAFRLQPMTIGADDDGEDITSCVAMPDESSGIVKRVKLPSGGNQKIALDALAEPLRKSTEFGKDGALTGRPCIRLDNAIALLIERLTCDAKHRKERAREAITGLVAKGIYELKGDWLWRA